MKKRLGQELSRQVYLLLFIFPSRSGSMLAEQEREQEATSGVLDFLWLEITGKCNLQCTHCYAGSLPIGTHGTLQPADWERIMSEAQQSGCKTVQFIGGEPTVTPYLLRLVCFAYELGLNI